MKVLVIGPSDTGSCGGMAEVIRGIRESVLLNREFEIDIFPSYIDEFKGEKACIKRHPTAG